MSSLTYKKNLDRLIDHQTGFETTAEFMTSQETREVETNAGSMLGHRLRRCFNINPLPAKLEFSPA